MAADTEKTEKFLEQLKDLLKGIRVSDLENAVKSLKESRKIATIAQPATVPFKDISDELKAKTVALFNAVDKDASGTIDEYELLDMLKQLLGEVTLAESNLIYQEMDTNHSGTITFDEFLEGLVKFKWDMSKIDLSSSQLKRTTNVYEWEVPHSELTMEKKLGEGAYGVVYRGKWRGITVAIKEMKDLDDEEAINDFRSEIAILGKLRHPNCVLFMGASTKPHQLCIITEFLEGGSVHDILHEQKRRFDLKTVVSLSKQTAFGVNYLHLSGILHRDLKPANLLVDKYYNLKLCDFGLSCFKPKEKVLTEKVGTPLWNAPEVLLKKPYDELADVYSFAICVWEIYTGEEPYLDIEDWDMLIREVANGSKRPKIPSTCPSDISSLIKACWDKEPKRRPNFGQLISTLERISQTV